jgi:hypothetical protein
MEYRMNDRSFNHPDYEIAIILCLWEAQLSAAVEKPSKPVSLNCGRPAQCRPVVLISFIQRPLKQRTDKASILLEIAKYVMDKKPYHLRTRKLSKFRAGVKEFIALTALFNDPLVQRSEKRLFVSESSIKASNRTSCGRSDVGNMSIAVAHPRKHGFSSSEKSLLRGATSFLTRR